MASERFDARWRRWLWLAVVLPLAAWVVWESQREFRADWASAAARQQVALWVGGGASAPEAARWEAARAALQSSLDITPDDPDAEERMGDLYTVAGQRDFAQPELRRRHFADAARHYEAATRLRPTEPKTWARLAVAYQAMGEDSHRVHDAWARALALGPLESHVQPVLMHVVLSDWDGASPAMRGWAEGLFDAGSEGTRRAINVMARRYGLLFSPSKPLQ